MPFMWRKPATRLQNRISSITNIRYPTFLNESWPALRIPCHQPTRQIWLKIVYQITCQVNQYINCVQQFHKSIKK